MHGAKMANWYLYERNISFQAEAHQLDTTLSCIYSLATVGKEERHTIRRLIKRLTLLGYVGV
jgi:hypothetical protein